MRMLYYVSYVLSAPFFLVAWIAYGVAYCFSLIGDVIFDATTGRIWSLLHRRECD